ncbi:hypothetical protein N8529_00725 [bacterium]|nr:hypothetical protein [bacterium]
MSNLITHRSLSLSEQCKVKWVFCRFRSLWNLVSGRWVLIGQSNFFSVKVVDLNELIVGFG